MAEGRGVTQDAFSPSRRVAASDEAVRKAPATPRLAIRKASTTPRSTTGKAPATPRSTVRTVPTTSKSIVRKTPATPKSTVRIAAASPKLTIKKVAGKPRSTVKGAVITPQSTMARDVATSILGIDEDEESDTSSRSFADSLDLEDRVSPSKRRKYGRNDSQIIVTTPTPPNKLVLEGRARKEILRKVAYSSSGDAFFDSLDPSLLRPVFHTLRLELRRLFLQENTVERRLPQADKFLHTSEAQNVVFSLENIGPFQQVLDKWSYTGPDQPGSLSPFHILTEWDDDSLVIEKPFSKLSKNDWGAGNHPLDFGTFSQRISSQLLLYRITLFFGTFPYRDTEEDAEEDPERDVEEDSEGGKNDSYCWKTTFYHVNKHSLIDLWDSNGVPHIYFQGSWGCDVSDKLM